MLIKEEVGPECNIEAYAESTRCEVDVESERVLCRPEPVVSTRARLTAGDAFGALPPLVFADPSMLEANLRRVFSNSLLFNTGKA